MSLHENDVIIDAQERVFMSVENEAVIVHPVLFLTSSGPGGSGDVKS